MNPTLSKKKLIVIALGILVILVLVLVAFLLLGPDLNNTSKKEITKTASTSAPKEKSVKFTHKIFDPEKVSFITPLGELNGGYEETQTINGVMINLKTDTAGNAPEIEVYAPVDMTLEDYSYFTAGPNTPNWHLGFRISPDLKLSFDHITSVPEAIKEVTPPTPTSGYVPPKKSLSFKAGDVIAKTSGTDKAHNWNIYLRDNRKTNIFVNQDRYEKLKDRYDFVNAACPFDYYEIDKQQQLLGLMGSSKAGQTSSCGSNSKDVKGTISGLWHLGKEGVQAEYQGQYATPFSIYKTSSNEIVIYEVNRKRYIIGGNNPTYKDPALVNGLHCYALTSYADSSVQGYLYFSLVSDQEMQMSYSEKGSCPATFPTNSKTYYR